MPTVRPSVTSKPTQPKRSRSQSRHPTTNENLSVVSDASDLVQYPDVEAVTQARAEAIKRAPERRSTEFNRKMASHAPRRTYSDSTAYRVRSARSTMDEERRKNESRRRHRLHASERTERGDYGERTHVLPNKNQSNRKDVDRKYRVDLARSKTTGGRNGLKYDRSHMENEMHERRYSERPSFRYDEPSHHTTLRREKRSVADNSSRPRRDEHPAK